MVLEDGSGKWIMGSTKDTTTSIFRHSKLMPMHALKDVVESDIMAAVGNWYQLKVEGWPDLL
jgi:hypothetical protein